MHGVGTHTNPFNHEVYQGQFENGMRHGKGRFTAKEKVDGEKPGPFGSTIIYTGTFNRGKKDGIFNIEIQGSNNKPEVVIYKSGTKLSKTTVDRGMRGCEKCGMFMQIVSFCILYIGFPIIYYLKNHTSRSEDNVPFYLTGGFWMLCTIAINQGSYNSSREYVAHTMNYGHALK